MRRKLIYLHNRSFCHVPPGHKASSFDRFMLRPLRPFFKAGYRTIEFMQRVLKINS